jgi:hypothetical protein
MDSLVNYIGTGSTITDVDAKCLAKISRRMYGNGFYTNAIYIDSFLENSRRVEDGEKEN